MEEALIACGTFSSHGVPAPPSLQSHHPLPCRRKPVMGDTAHLLWTRCLLRKVSHRWALASLCPWVPAQGACRTDRLCWAGQVLPRPRGPVQDMGWGGAQVMLSERLGRSDLFVALLLGFSFSCGVWGVGIPVPALFVSFLFISHSPSFLKV